MDTRNRACPACKAVGRDKDSDHLFLMQDGRTWGCSKNSDVHPPHAPYYEKADDNLSTFEQAIASQKQYIPPAETGHLDFHQIQKLESGAIRGVPADVAHFYGVKIECDQVTGQPLTHYYPMTSKGGLVSYHVRKLPKQFFHLHKRHELPEHLDLFGMLTMNVQPHYILITEGEIDAMSAWVMLAGNKGVKRLRCLSLPTGNNLAAVQQNAMLLNQARDLIFCPDQDDAGRKLIPEMWKLFPKIRIMQFSEKDADDMLQKGKVQEFYESFQYAETYKPSAIVSSRNLKAEAMKPVESGLDYPFPSLTKLTFGIRTPRLIGIGAGPGTGKTVLMQTLIMHLVMQHRHRASVFSLEEQPADSLRRMAGHIMGLPIHLPNVSYDPKQLEAIIDALEGRLFYYDHSGYRDWDDIEEIIRFLAYDGVKFFFIDPLSALHTHLDAGATNQFLNKAMFQMSRMIHELDITIFHVNHLNNPMTGKDHNEGATVKASQFTGSRSQWRFSTDVWGLRRDSANADPGIQNTTYFTVIKNRLSGMLGEFVIRYNHSTGRLEEPPLPTNF